MAVFSCNCLGDDLPSKRDLNKYKTLLCACSFFRNQSVFITSWVGVGVMDDVEGSHGFQGRRRGDQSPLTEYKEGFFRLQKDPLNLN